jgi:maltooligosyltrehalose trehalohydrolase
MNMLPGATDLGGGRCQFRVWAPFVNRIEIHIVSPEERTVPIAGEGGYHQGIVEEVHPGALYFYRLDGDKDRPDPASRFQPRGVHGPSQVVRSQFSWEDRGWVGLPLQDYVFYELHVGTYTRPGTFEAILSHLDDLRDLGITALEIMPVAQFPGNRNWGYDGVHPFAAQNSYGGPEGLKKLVNACHQRGMALVLDVVYNHLGPEGNYLRDFGPYFTDRYRTPWGEAINFDGPESDEVRRFFIGSALYWMTEFHIDALRIDAVHAILDFSARPFLQEFARAIRVLGETLNRRVYLIAESDLNDNRILRSSGLGGIGLDAQWNDDFHHALHALLTGEKSGYYQDFGTVGDLGKAMTDGFVYDGRYSAFRRRRHGNSSRKLSSGRFVVFSQNHDQVGNRPLGERLSRLISLEGLKLAAGITLLSPFLPLLFMGEEYGETAPFFYFISHGDPDLIEAVRQGRQEAFRDVPEDKNPPDPDDEEIFLLAKLNHALRQKAPHRNLYDYYRELLSIRKSYPALASPAKERQEVVVREEEKILIQRRWQDREELTAVYYFGKSPSSVTLPLSAGTRKKILASADARWAGPGSGIPDGIVSEGGMNLKLASQSFFLLAGERKAP